METKNEKIYYTASGIPIPKQCVIELDKNNLVAVWNWKKLKKYNKNGRETILQGTKDK